MREATDLVALVGEHIPLRLKGREHVGLCPFHDDHTPSFSVVTHKGNAFFKCHSCGAAGDAFNFVQDYHRMSFGEALRHLAERAGITLQRGSAPPRASGEPSHADLRRANEVAAAFYRSVLGRQGAGAEARSMIRNRRIADETAKSFGIGAAPDAWDELARHAAGKGVTDAALRAAGLVKPRSNGQGHYDTFRNRLMFPICDELGRPIAFGGRQLDDDQGPKYLNSAETPLFNKSGTLYGLHLAKRAVIDAGRVIVTEGYTDVVACHQAGFGNVVATLGTALTRDHVRMLKRICEEVVLVFDGDQAGQRAADRAVELLFAELVDVKICILPEGNDPADLLGQPDGCQRLAGALDAANDALAYKVDRFRAELAAARGPAGRQRTLERTLATLSELGFDALPGVRKRPVIAQLADLMEVRIEDIEQAVPRRRRAAPPVRTGGEPQEVSTGLFDGQADAPAARQRAERELLAALTYQPSLSHQPVAADDGSDASVTGRLRPEQFCDPAARVIAEAVWPRLEQDRPFTVQQLMGELDRPQLRTLVGELYVEMETLLGVEKRSALEHFRSRVIALERLVSLEGYQRDLETYRRGTREAGSAADLERLLEQRRRQGYIPEAMPLRVRS